MSLERQYPWTSIKLDTPDLELLQKALTNGLKNNFAEVIVEVVDCPDLRNEPFYLASEGLGGNTSLLDVGGPPYLLPLVKRDKVYDLRAIAKQLGTNPAFMIGAGAGPWPLMETNCEMITNVVVDGDNIKSESYIAKVNVTTDGVEVMELPQNSSNFALMANLYTSEGKPGKVLKIHCKKRTGEKDFITSVRTSLAAELPSQTIGLGGTFLLKMGKAKQHVMPDFSKTPINTEDQLNKWLNFYNMSAPLIACGTLVSKDIPELDMRIQHFHSFSKHNEGGHYHYDVTPDSVEYLAYFNVAENLHRVDKPKHTHKLGRD